MSFWQPRSVLQLVFFGFFAALAPLCVAILFTLQTLGELAENNSIVTQQVVDASRLGLEVQRDLLELERRARQYMALADSELAELFERERTILIEDLQTLQRRLPTSSPDVAGLVGSLERLNLASAAELDPATPEALAGRQQRLTQPFNLISEQGKALQKWLQSTVDRLLEKNVAQADALIEQLVLQLVLLASATLALLLFFSYWINKPVRDLTQEIHQLGTEGLSHTIEISGPQEMRELGSKLEWLRQQLHENEQQKQQFLRHVSHELKTPLSSLREGADLLAEHVPGRLSQQQEEIVEIVQQNGIELQRLIENLIDYNQLPRQQLNYEEVALDELWQELQAHYTISMDSKNLSLDTHGFVDSWVVDRSKLRTTLDNLLSNAVNYTPEGGRIEVVWREKNATLVIDIANSGEPIPTEDAERVFEPFFQSAAKRTGPIKGSGIGLSVARECMEAQGGSLAVVSHLSLPVCFRLTCPAH